MNECNLYTIDCDTCPKFDNIICNNQCGDCEYYNGFEMYHDQRCVKCSYYTNDNTNKQ